MDFILGIDGPSEGVPRVLVCFSNNLLRREPLKLVDGGQSQRTFVYIKDTSLVEKYKISDEACDKLDGTYRKFKEKLGLRSTSVQEKVMGDD
ncbi:hypothetical protein L2E82_51879 [Cichorium intybus]|nr:hypothetical protein L2E82_51879 [Cichorium intybus]